jgi:hypothetical protein
MNAITHTTKATLCSRPMWLKRIRNTFDWEAAQLALDSDSFELDAASLPRGSSVCVHGGSRESCDHEPSCTEE